MVRFGEKEIAKELFYAAKRPIKICHVNVDNIVIPKLVKTKTNSKYLIGYLDKAIRQLVLIMTKMSGYEVKEGDDDKLLEKYKAIWTKIEDLKKNELNALPVHDDIYIKTKIRT